MRFCVSNVKPLSPYVYIQVLAYTVITHQVMPRGHTEAYLC